MHKEKFYVYFLTTPDGHEGWPHYFLRRGFPVYIVDVPGHGRAGFMPDPFNNVKTVEQQQRSDRRASAQVYMAKIDQAY